MSGQRLPALKPKEVLRALQRAGFYVHHTKGSHHILKHPARPHLRITLPMHGADLKRRTLQSIIDQSGLSAEEFIALL
jgi:predicted RNA binding protein YcfA (HicA-like mRNA interferase family)